MAYTVSGTRWLDNGKEFQFHGQNTTGFETKDGVLHCLWDGLSFKEYVANIKAEGFNAVRVPVGSETLQNVEVNPDHTGVNWYPPNAYMKGMKSLDLFKAYIAELELQGMRYIIDMHYIEDGKLQPLWYTAKYSELQWLSDIEKVAFMFRGNRGYVGIDIKNEPDANGGCTWGTGNAATDFKIAAEKAAAVILRVNPDLLVIVEWIRTSFSDQIKFPLNIPADKLVMSDHVYGDSVWGPYTNDFKDPNFPRNMPGIWDAMFGNYARTHAVFHGEFGGKYVDKDKQWHDTFIPYLLSLTPTPCTAWWCMMDDSWDTGGIMLPGSKSKNQQKLDMLKPLRTALATYTEVIPMPRPTPDPVNPVNPVTPGTFAVGNIVELISGSPRMVVSGVPATGGNVEVTYFNQVSGAIVGGKVPASVLKLSGAAFLESSSADTLAALRFRHGFATDQDLVKSEESITAEQESERLGARARLIAEGKITSDHVKPSAVSPGRRVSIIPTPEVDAGE